MDQSVNSFLNISWTTVERLVAHTLIQPRLIEVLAEEIAPNISLNHIHNCQEMLDSFPIF